MDKNILKITELIINYRTELKPIPEISKYFWRARIVKSVLNPGSKSNCTLIDVEQDLNLNNFIQNND